MLLDCVEFYVLYFGRRKEGWFGYVYFLFVYCFVYLFN